MPSLSDIKKTIIGLKIEYEIIAEISLRKINNNKYRTISFYIIDNRIYIIEYDCFYSKHIIHSWNFKTNIIRNVNLNDIFRKYYKIDSYIEFKNIKVVVGFDENQQLQIINETENYNFKKFLPLTSYLYEKIIRIIDNKFYLTHYGNFYHLDIKTGEITLANLKNTLYI